MSKTQTDHHDQLVKESGPYKVDSMALSLGELRVRPKWQEYGDDWQTQQLNGQGGGPGVFSRLALAESLEEILNRNQVPQAALRWKTNPIANMTHQEIQDAQDRAAGLDPERRLVIHVSPEQEASLESIAADEGISISLWLRLVVAQAIRVYGK